MHQHEITRRLIEMQNQGIPSVMEYEMLKDEFKALTILTPEARQLDIINHAKHHGIKILGANTAEFGDQEIRPRILESIRGMDVYVVQNAVQSENPVMLHRNLEELKLAVSTARRSHAAHIVAVLPYLPYARQEKRDGREPISIKDLVDDLYNRGADELITMDMHSSAIEGFGSARGLMIQNLYGSQEILDYFKAMEFEGVWIAPDAGSAKRVRYYSNISGLPIALAEKFRPPGSVDTKQVHRLLGDVRGTKVCVLDDMICGGSTMVDIIEVALSPDHGGETGSYGAATHGLFMTAGGSAEGKFQKAVAKGMISKVVITNTIIHSKEFLERNPYIVVLDVMGLFAGAIYQNNVDGSISSLYTSKWREAMFGKDHRTVDGS